MHPLSTYTIWCFEVVLERNWLSKWETQEAAEETRASYLKGGCVCGPVYPVTIQVPSAVIQ